MSLHNGIDTIAIATIGIYSSTYGSAGQQNICNLYASFGFIEDAPTGILGRFKNKIAFGLSLLLSSIRPI